MTASPTIGRPPSLVATPIGDDRFAVPNTGDPDSRDVVFGGQLMSQFLVIASDRHPGKEAKTIHTVFARAARVSDPLEIGAETMHAGRAFGSETLTATQNGKLCSRATVLLSADEPDTIRHTIAMPAVDGPESCTPQGPAELMFPGAGFGIVGNVDTWSVNAPSGPAELNVWMRYGAAGGELCVSQAVLAYGTDGYLIGAAMRPQDGYAQDRAHIDLSTGVVSHTMTFHERFDVADWLLIAQEVVYTGRGRVYGRGNVFTAGGSLIASFVQDSIVRSFAADVSPEGQHRTIM